MKIAIGTDHRGVAHKEFIKKNLTVSGLDIIWIDVGCDTTESCHYPEFAQFVAQKIQNKEVDVGILLCGTGVGMSIAANRFGGVYAGLAWNEAVAKLNKEHDHVNVLVLPADFISHEQSVAMIAAWLQTEKLDGKYKKRIEMIDKFL